MPFTIWGHFDAFRQNIEPPPYAKDAASGRVSGIVSHLGGTFDILKSFQTGSVPRFTAIRGHSDLDLFVVLHFGKHCKNKTPRQVLGAVRNRLGSYERPSRVRQDGQAITLSYATWPDVDVVPVYYTGESLQKVSYYSIADSISDEWIETKPILHDNRMRDANAAGGQFKHTVKMIKWWNRIHGGVMRSYHLEVVALRAYNDGGAFGDYPWDVVRWFDKANDLLKEGYLWHENSMVDAYLTYTQRQDLKAKIARGHDLAVAAWHRTYGTNDDVPGAVRLWQQLFGREKFPSYG